ncbi:hypothetical protein MKX01_026736 [Papaver californicum]|nr:hypothetical protein MKX01_026736 [Papaver californicum]
MRNLCRKTTSIDRALNFSTWQSSSLLHHLPKKPILHNIEVHRRKRKLAELLQIHVPNKPHLFYKKVYGVIIISGFQSELFLTNVLLNKYSKSGCLYEARLVFDRMSERNLITWSSMISMYTQHGQCKEALVIFAKFQVSSYENPNDFILSSVLRACTQLRDVKQAIQVHGFVIKAGFGEDVYVGTSLIDFYCKSGDIEEAKLIFDDLPVKTAVTWTTIIMGRKTNPCLRVEEWDGNRYFSD